jgi:hypothetical protein
MEGGEEREEGKGKKEKRKEKRGKGRKGGERWSRRQKRVPGSFLQRAWLL